MSTLRPRRPRVKRAARPRVRPRFIITSNLSCPPRSRPLNHSLLQLISSTAHCHPNQDGGRQHRRSASCFDCQCTCERRLSPHHRALRHWTCAPTSQSHVPHEARWHAPPALHERGPRLHRVVLLLVKEARPDDVPENDIREVRTCKWPAPFVPPGSRPDQSSTAQHVRSATYTVDRDIVNINTLRNYYTNTLSRHLQKPTATAHPVHVQAEYEDSEYEDSAQETEVSSVIDLMAGTAPDRPMPPVMHPTLCRLLMPVLLTLLSPGNSQRKILRSFC